MVFEASWLVLELEEEMEGEGRPERLVMECAQEMMEERTWERTKGTAQEWQDVVEAPVEAAAEPDLLLAPHA